MPFILSLIETDSKGGLKTLQCSVFPPSVFVPASLRGAKRKQAHADVQKPNLLISL
jgi:hypothetical protein